MKIISIADSKLDKDFIKDFIGKKCYTRGVHMIKQQKAPDSIIVGLDPNGFIETKYLYHLDCPVKFSHSYVVVDE